MKKIIREKSMKVLNSKTMRTVTGGDASTTASPAHKRISDVSGVLIGAVLIGGAAQ